MTPPYRLPTEPAPEPPDVELLIMNAYAARARRVLRGVVFASAAVLIASAPFLYGAVQEIQFALAGVAFVKLTAIVSIGVPLIGLLRGVRPVSNAVLRMLGPRWRRELAARHGVTEAHVEELTAHL